MDTVVVITCILLSVYTINGQLLHSTIVFAPSELITDNTITNITGTGKSALRYGFHQTSECDNYEKAFLCIQKCIDKGYNVAYSDKYCFCTCYVKKHKAKYTPAPQSNITRWKLGTPKTTKPAWIQKLEISKKVPKKVGDSISTVRNETENIQILGEKTVTNNINITDVNSTQSDLQNATASENVVNETKSTNLTENQTVSNATNGTDTENVRGATNVTSSENLSSTPNATDSAVISNTTNTAESLNVTSATNVTGSLKESDTSNGTIGDVTNATNIQNSSQT